MEALAGRETLLSRVMRLSKRVRCEPYQFNVVPLASDAVIITAMLWRRDMDDPEGKFSWGESGQQVIRFDYTDDAIFKRFFVAAIGYAEHEVREAFELDGVKVFDPHYPLQILQNAHP